VSGVSLFCIARRQEKKKKKKKEKTNKTNAGKQMINK